MKLWTTSNIFNSKILDQRLQVSQEKLNLENLSFTTRCHQKLNLVSNRSEGKD